MQPRQSTELVASVQKILTELLDGSPDKGAFVLNPKDPGLLKSIARLSAKEASVSPASGGAPIAAHVDHLCYGFNLLRRWSEGEDPFASADYSKSWERTRVSDKEWTELQESLRREAGAWHQRMGRRVPMNEVETTGLVGSVAHLAYHLGAIRQINRSIRGPAEGAS